MFYNQTAMQTSRRYRFGAANTSDSNVCEMREKLTYAQTIELAGAYAYPQAPSSVHAQTFA
jgi:hypothetical protein